MPLFSELALFLGINTVHTPHLSRWKTEQANLSALDDELLRIDELPQFRGSFETPTGTNEMIHFFDDIFAIFRGRNFQNKAYQERLTYITSYLEKVGGKLYVAQQEDLSNLTCRFRMNKNYSHNILLVLF